MSAPARSQPSPSFAGAALWRAAAALVLLSSVRCGKTGPLFSMELPGLSGVQVRTNGDNVSIDFLPYANAQDYRIYELTTHGNVSVDPDGYVGIQGGTYRCAGAREAPVAREDGEPLQQSESISTYVEYAVEGYTRTLAEATLGYVYTQPGAGLVPVYALGDSSPNADDACFAQRWQASRAKVYTADPTERAALLAQQFRDDGIAFYVPASAGSGTAQVAVMTGSTGGRLYYVAGSAEASARGGGTAAFNILTAQAPGTDALMRAYYANSCGMSHDELTVGLGGFAKIRRQGYTPITHLLWAGLTHPTTLVVEALDSQCPYQGFISSVPLPASPPHPAYLTPDALRATSGRAELFVNGQGPGTNRPKAIARSFISVAPQPDPAMDWFDGFSPGSTLAPFSVVGTSFQGEHLLSSQYDVSVYSVDTNGSTNGLQYALGSMMGELWVAYADWASNTNGKLRITPLKNATLSASSFVHVTMQVDDFTTGRRYPQLLLSTVPPPVQDSLAQGVTLILQSYGDWPDVVQLQICDHRTWDVNNQCPTYDFYPAAFSGLTLPPIPEVAELQGVDRHVQLDLYASTSRAYVFVDQQPYGCANLPGGVLPAGTASVTFGDVLFDSSIDLSAWDTFHAASMQSDTRRHFDNLGFRSNVPAPAWDEARLPCTSTLN